MLSLLCEDLWLKFLTVYTQTRTSFKKKKDHNRQSRGVLEANTTSESVATIRPQDYAGNEYNNPRMWPVTWVLLLRQYPQEHNRADKHTYSPKTSLKLRGKRTKENHSICKISWTRERRIRLHIYVIDQS